jgi:hypothetical protein
MRNKGKGRAAETEAAQWGRTHRGRRGSARRARNAVRRKTGREPPAEELEQELEEEDEEDEDVDEDEEEEEEKETGPCSKKPDRLAPAISTPRGPPFTLDRPV